MNSINLTGRITKDLEMKQTKANKPMVSFVLASKRKLSNSNGEKQTDFFNCVAFGPRAEFLHNYAKQSTVIGISGRIQSKVIVDGDKRFNTVDVICESVEILNAASSKKTGNKEEHTIENKEEEITNDFFAEENKLSDDFDFKDESSTQEDFSSEHDEEEDPALEKMLDNFSSFFND